MGALEKAMVLPILDGLTAIAPLGFRRAELSFVRGGEHGWVFDQVAVDAPADAPRLDDVVDGKACARLLTHFASDLGPHLGPDWDGLLTLARGDTDWVLGCNVAAELSVDQGYANGRTFDDAVLLELARLRGLILERQGSFVETYGVPDERWDLDPAVARLTTPNGPLACALVGVHEGTLFHWSPLVDGPPPALVEPMRALVASGMAPHAIARGRVVLADAVLGHPLAWLAAEPLGAEAVLLWPAEGRITLLLALLAP